MPRRTSFGNDEGNEPHRSHHRASREQLNYSGESASASSGTAQREATSAASAVAQVSSSLQRAVAASGDATTAATDSPQQQQQQQLFESASQVSFGTRKRAPSNDNVPSRKKSRSTRVSLNNDNKNGESSNDDRKESPNVKLKYPSTITPVCNESTRARMDQQDENASSSTALTNANLLRSNTNDAGDESSTTSTTGSSILTTDVPVLPEGVVDLYSSDSCKKGTCQQHCTATQALTAAFLSTYGHEYYQNLKDQEHRDDASSSSCTSSTTTRPSHGTTPRSHAVVKPVLGTGPLVGDLETIPCQPHLTEKMRAILMDWLVELVEEYKLSPQTLHLAMTLVDQSFARGSPTLLSEESDFFTIQREMLQCVGCACIWIASKIEETEPPCVVDFVYISDNSYTKEQITDMELTVCTALEFRLSQVTPYHYIYEFLRAGCGCGDSECCAPENALMRNMVLYLLELSLLPSELAYTSASLKAAAAVYVARVTLGIHSDGGLWNKTLQHYTGYTLADLEETALTIHRYHYAAEDSQLTSCFRKFSKEKYNNVALKTVPLESELGF